ncbi:hypothetical protein [Labrenzia sp. DG1229]|uniref:hypothetical protein n=1 Tax=Labrenzia sp. DG1229 TaxID=681847 RepID=UPI0012EC15A8|nr:hypothetical protein [Labrenzia sp. DG1229]
MEISYHSPFTGKTEDMRTSIGGRHGPTEVEIVSGSIGEGQFASEIAVTVLDNQIAPNLIPGPRSVPMGYGFWLYGAVNAAIDGIAAPTKVYVTVIGSKTLSLPVNAEYVPGYLDNLGFDPKNPPVGYNAVYDAQGNLIGFSQSAIDHCFLTGTPISMWDGTEKPIEFVKPGDVVTSYDEDGNLVPGRVSKTKENRVNHILDVFGLMVTPGHVTLCGDGKFEGQHVPMIDILRSDSALVLEDGSMKRAATNFAVGSIEDCFVHAIVTEDVPGTDSVRVIESGQIRLGTRYMHPTGADITVLEIIRRTGGSLTDDGYVILSDGSTKTPFVWTFTNRLPKPEDFVLQRSQVTLTDIYEADEWEAVAPQVPPPYRGEAGPSFANISGGHQAPGHEDNRPPNIPISMRGAANQPTMSRMQRRAHEARQRKQAKRMTRTTN